MSVIMDVWIYNVIFLTLCYEVILSKTEETKEFCHNERQMIERFFDCDVGHITISVEGDPNHVDQCDWNQGKMWCINGNYYNTNKSLTFSFNFKLEHHAGKQLIIRSWCKNRKHVNKSIILMIPCRSEFTVSATYNKEHMNLTCRHKFFHLLPVGLHIKRKNEDGFIVTCTWNRKDLATQCTTIEKRHAHKNGIASYKAKYPGEYQCVMGGQIIDIPSREVPTFKGNTTKKQNSWINTGNFRLISKMWKPFKKSF
ncbi:uncharacterized protein LOC134265199 [Saccostrea cucullata]|uniref:uncharacterized protein LOC134265199 n=1 Tax=Saccostrea cuccullata TaxID=36930 RepID=UPI002ED3CBB6